MRQGREIVGGASDRVFVSLMKRLYNVFTYDSTFKLTNASTIVNSLRYV